MLISVLLFVLFGFVVGAVARMLTGPATSLWESAAVGVAGSLLGGMLARGLGWMATPWSIPGLLVALLGALVLIAVARAVRGPAAV